MAYRLAEWLADVQCRLSACDRRAVQANLGLVLGASVSGHSPLVAEVFRNFGRYLVEFFTAHGTPSPEVEVEGYEHLETAQAARRGAILLTAHLGNWEVGAVLVRRLGFPVTVVVLPHLDPQTDRLFNRQRERCGIHVVPLGRDAAHESLRQLREGQLLGLIGDRVFARRGIQIPLFGRSVILPIGPALLSLRSQAPVVPIFCIREAPWKFRLSFESPIWPAGGRLRDGAVHAMTAAYATALERYVRRFPSQWLLFQPMAHSG
jgi:KDO2-lipid IV(A) lauroyltransferase